jgi:hypothetical protein
MLLALVASPLFVHLEATEIHVSSVAALQAAVTTASAGDVLVLDNGLYTDNTLAISTGSITVKAATPGGVSLNGTNEISISGSNVVFSGFQFTSGGIGGIVIIVSGNNVVLTQLNFKGYSAQKYINLQGQYDEVSFCNFENKPTTAPIGNLIHIAPDGAVPNYARIRYCSFRNMPGAGGDNGNECIRIANGAQSTYICRTIIEYCYFENTGMGDSECISNKSRENVIRYNTFRNNQEAMLCFRNGDDAVAYGNFFINAGGIRVKEANNIFCYNNYFENSGSTGSQGCMRYVYYTANTTHVLVNINFLHNTFVDCGLIDFDKGATNNTWANNIFKKSSGNIFTGSAPGISWAGNISAGTPGIPISSGMTYADPKLVLNADGYYGLSSSSPAIDASSANYPPVLDIDGIDDDPAVLRDISGQSRPAARILKDVGCDEFATDAITRRPLTLSEVGPSYLGGPATGVAAGPSERTQGVGTPGYLLNEAFPNPFNPSTEIRFQIGGFGLQNVSLAVFDLLGREAATLVNESREPGYYAVSFDARNLAGGVYLYRLIAGPYVSSRRMLLLR